MLLLGLILLAIAVLLLLAGLFAAGDGSTAHQAATILGIHLGATTVFLLGFIAGLALLFGFSITKWGGKRQIRQARERRRLEGLAHRLEEVESQRDGHEESKNGE
ncbi:MAG: hypothetical protein QM638_15770 [Nocardioides sp.]|uniref:hypothetical protein n=1 Tax=Nocardioides sp. TaxID=35761 RepID=UPI0039E30D19